MRGDTQVKPVFLYNLADLERFRWEGRDALTPGKHTIVFDFKYDGPVFGKGGTGILKVDDKEVAIRFCGRQYRPYEFHPSQISN
jgi:hypothetical protein